MLGKVRKIIRVGFGSKLAIATVVFLAAQLIALPTPFLRLAALLTWSVFAESFALFVLCPTLASTLRLLLLFRKAKPIDMPDEIKTLSLRMGVQKKVRKVMVVDGLYNAFVMCGIVVLRKELLDRLDVERSLAVVAHEFAHIRDACYGTLVTVLLVALNVFMMNNLTYPSEGIRLIAQLAYSLISMIPAKWYLEYRADKIGAEAVGKTTMIKALRTLGDTKDLDEHSFDHPSINSRIRRLET